ncbi:MAG: metallophosphoesterase, partial [Acidobacteriota bacterium]
MQPRPHNWRPAKTTIAALLLALLQLLPATGPAWGEAIDYGRPGTGRRIVAIGDIHGAYNGMREILRRVGIIDQKDRWVGGDSILVQTGDFLDRGPGATKVAELLMDLQQQAPKQGGEAIILLGNHEILNLLGDLRDVTKYILRNFVDGHSEKRLTVSCNDYAAFHRRLHEVRREKSPKRRDLIDRCFTEHPLGLVEYLEEMSPSGKIGRWMRRLPVVAQVDGIVFVHGGISPELSGTRLNEINREVRREIKSFDAAKQHLVDRGFILPTASLGDVVQTVRALAGVNDKNNGKGNRKAAKNLSPELAHVLELPEWLTVSEDGPLWFRGYARWSEEEGREQIGPILERMQAGHVVVGHTPQAPFKIRPRFDS